MMTRLSRPRPQSSLSHHSFLPQIKLCESFRVWGSSSKVWYRCSLHERHRAHSSTKLSRGWKRMLCSCIESRILRPELVVVAPPLSTCRAQKHRLYRWLGPLLTARASYTFSRFGGNPPPEGKIAQYTFPPREGMPPVGEESPLSEK